MNLEGNRTRKPTYFLLINRKGTRNYPKEKDLKKTTKDAEKHKPLWFKNKISHTNPEILRIIAKPDIIYLISKQKTKQEREGKSN